MSMLSAGSASAALWLFAGLCAAAPTGDGPSAKVLPDRADLEVAVDRPEAFCNGVLALFTAERYPSPAAAIAAWKRASGGSCPLPKAWEAGLVTINPEMAREWRCLDGGTFELRWAGGSAPGAPRWRVRLPKAGDSGEAMLTALALTLSGKPIPAADTTVLRLGAAPDSPVGRVQGDCLVVASGLAELAQAENPSGSAVPPTGRPGASARINLEALGAADAPLIYRQLARLLTGFGAAEIAAHISLEADQLAIRLEGRSPAEPPGPSVFAAIDPDWLAFIPRDRAIAAICLGLNRDPAASDRLIAAIDRALRLDPREHKAAPLETRLKLWSALLGWDARAELGAHCRGVILIALSSDRDPENPDWCACLQLDSPTIAATGSERLRHRLNRVLGRDAVPFIAAVGTALVIGSDESACNLCIAAAKEGPGSVPAPLRPAAGAVPRVRLGAFWPARRPESRRRLGARAEALDRAGPVVWEGFEPAAKGASLDVITIARLKTLVHETLESLPIDQNAAQTKP